MKLFKDSVKNVTKANQEHNRILPKVKLRFHTHVISIEFPFTIL